MANYLIFHSLSIILPCFFDPKRWTAWPPWPMAHSLILALRRFLQQGGGLIDEPETQAVIFNVSRSETIGNWNHQRFTKKMGNPFIISHRNVPYCSKNMFLYYYGIILIMVSSYDIPILNTFWIFLTNNDKPIMNIPHYMSSSILHNWLSTGLYIYNP